MGKVLPRDLRIIFDYQDDEQDRMQAEVRRVRADKRRINLETGMTTVRVEREQMLSDGEINEAQFASMELEDGRLPDLIELGIPDPLLISENDPEVVLIAIEAKRVEIYEIAGRANNKAEKERVLWALKALEHLEEIYAESLEQQMEEEALAQMEQEQMAAENVDESSGGNGAKPPQSGGRVDESLATKRRRIQRWKWCKATPIRRPCGRVACDGQ
jgi:hypothetical protein